MTADPSHEKALEPCPFCGGKADFNNDGGWWHQVICGSCGAHGPEHPGEGGKAKALAGWNRRAPLTARVPDDVADLVEELTTVADVEEASDGWQPAIKAMRRAADLLTLQSERIRGLEAEVERKDRALREIEAFTEPAPDDDPMSHVHVVAHTAISPQPKDPA